MQKLHLDLSKGYRVFFTSDLHIGHRNILIFCNRPFQNTKEMEDKLIENWNSVVGENDIVFDLGDMFWWDSRHEVKRVVEKLNGHIYKIDGNHDMNCQRLFELCDPQKVTCLSDNVELFIERPGQKTLDIWISHFVLETWPHKSGGAFNFFGHIHSGPLSDNKVDIPGKDLQLVKGQQYDVGVDNNNFTPIELQDILKKLEAEKLEASESINKLIQTFKES